MGIRGPVGKHPARRHGHGSKADRSHDAVPAGAALDWPPVNGHWHDTAKRWYRSLRTSGQVADYQQSDTVVGYMLADQLSRELNLPGPMGAAALAAFLSGCSDLLATAGSRRRVRMELASGEDPQAGAHLAAVESLTGRRPRTGEEPEPDDDVQDPDGPA